MCLCRTTYHGRGASWGCSLSCWRRRTTRRCRRRRGSNWRKSRRRTNFREYAEWERSEERSKAASEALQYWSRELSEGTDRGRSCRPGRPPQAGHEQPRGASVHFAIEAKEWRR